MSLNYAFLEEAFGNLGLGNVPVIAHASLRAFGHIEGGADSLISALLPNLGALMMPTHTYNTMLTPRAGPPHNAMTYGQQQDLNRMAEFFHPRMPADRMMGRVAETLRLRPDSRRSMHPIQSFAGVNVRNALAAQTLADPLAPLRLLAESDGWVLLLGVDHTVNTTIHLAEKIAGRKQFTRWALTPEGVVQTEGFPGCSAGFQALAPEVESITRRMQIGEALVQALPMRPLIQTVYKRLQRNPKDLLCENPACERCNEIRNL